MALVRQMKIGEENKVRELAAKLDDEDQATWRKRTKPLGEYLSKWSGVPISSEIKGKNVVLVAEHASNLVGLCWCTIVDRGVDRQGEIGEFYVAEDYRNTGIGRQLLAAAKQLFIDEVVDVAFVWVHQGHQVAIRLYEDAGFKGVDQLVMAFVP